jgi:hypothetical protein
MSWSLAYLRARKKKKEKKAPRCYAVHHTRRQRDHATCPATLPCYIASTLSLVQLKRGAAFAPHKHRGAVVAIVLPSCRRMSAPASGELGIRLGQFVECQRSQHPHNTCPQKTRKTGRTLVRARPRRSGGARHARSNPRTNATSHGR